MSDVRGPWRRGTGEVNYGEHQIVDSDGRVIASVSGGWVDYGRFDANARLIAAAPDLLEALEAEHDQLLRALEALANMHAREYRTAYDATELACTAIAKARGGDDE